MPDKNFAVIDIGSNSFHFIISKIDANKKFKTILKEKEVLRLNWLNGSTTKFASDSMIEKAVSALKRFKSLSVKYNAPLKAVATSALRELENRDQVLKKVYEETEIEIEIISGYREAELIYKGILNALDVKEKKLLCIDIGGGSTEFTLAENEKIFFTESKKLGAVRLTNLFFKDYIVTEEGIDFCRKYVKDQLKNIKEILVKEKYDCCIGTSGTMLATGVMIRAKKSGRILNKILNNYKISAVEIFEIENQILSNKTLEERLSIPGLEEKRADVIPAGIIILTTIVEELNINEITLSSYAIREGVLSELNEEKKK